MVSWNRTGGAPGSRRHPADFLPFPAEEPIVLCCAAAARMLRGLIVMATLGWPLWAASGAAAENWPQWRGPQGNGASAETGLPLRWSDAEGLAWKCELPPWGNSTPAIWGDAIFLTTQTEDNQLQLLKIDRRDGKLLWNRTVGQGEAPRPEPGKPLKGDRGRQLFHKTQNFASPSPVTDGRLVIVHFGNGDLAAYDFAGAKLWARNLQDDFGRYTIWWGHANSPVLFDDLVLNICVQDSLVDLDKPVSPSYVVAHEKQTGKLRWKTPRMTAATSEACDAYTTPVFWSKNGRPQMIVMGGLVLDGYDPQSGKQLWQLAELGGDRTITSSVVAGDVLYTTEGKRAALLAVRLVGEGKRPASDILWKDDQNTPDSPTPVVSGGRVYTVADNGIARCLDARSGEVRWKERLPGQYRASPLAADGRIYFLNMEGLCTVVADGAQFEKLAENRLGDATIASPAVSAGRIFIRGNKALYCIGKPL